MKYIINDDDTLAEMMRKVKNAFMLRAEHEFHKAWEESMEWIRSGQPGTKKLYVNVHVADIASMTPTTAEPPEDTGTTKNQA